MRLILNMTTVLLLTVCVGCQSSTAVSPLGSTGILPLGPDTYRIQAPSQGVLFGGSTAAQKAAIEEGNNYCAQQGKQFLAIGTFNTGRADSSPVGLFLNTEGGGFQLDFRCLNKGDPGLLRPTPVPAPNIVIQDQRSR